MLRNLRNHTKTIMIVIIVTFVLSIFGGYGLYMRGNRGGGGGMRDYAVAKVSGKKVMRSTIENGVGRMAEYVSQGRELTSADLPALRQAVLNQIAIQSELEKELKKRSIKVHNDEIDAHYKQIMDSYPTREAFMEYLENSGIKESAVKEDIKKQIMQRKLFAQETAGVSVDISEAKEFYNIAKDFLYKQQAGIKVNLATFYGKSAAEKARSAIEAGTPWDKAIADNKGAVQSATPYNKPMILTDSMMTDSLKMLKNYPDNKITPVVEITSTDVYIAIRRGVSSERVLPFAEISNDVVAQLRSQKIQNKEAEFMNTLLARANVQILDDTIFPSEPAPPTETSPDEKPEN